KKSAMPQRNGLFAKATSTRRRKEKMATKQSRRARKNSGLTPWSFLIAWDVAWAVIVRKRCWRLPRNYRRQRKKWKMSHRRYARKPAETHYLPSSERCKTFWRPMLCFERSRSLSGIRATEARAKILNVNN